MRLRVTPIQFQIDCEFPPSALFPGLATVASSGLPGYEAVPVYGAWAHTPAAIVNRLKQEIVRTMNQADAKERFLNAGLDPNATSPNSTLIPRLKSPGGAQ